MFWCLSFKYLSEIWAQKGPAQLLVQDPLPYTEDFANITESSFTGIDG